MKNKERKDITDFLVNNMAINKNRKIVNCKDLVCVNCIFNNKNCEKQIKDWLDQEYVEKKEFTQQEKDLIKALDKVRYVTKDKNGFLCGYSKKPNKSTTGKWLRNNINDNIVYFENITSCEFKAIKWEDSEPTTREEILRGEE